MALINCQECQKQISNKATACPYCGYPNNSIVVINNNVENQKKEEVAIGTLVCSYVLSLLMPFFGFIMGIYLIAKGKTGHGIACLAISFNVFIFLFAINGGFK